MSFGVPLQQGNPVAIKDEGITLTANVGSIDFVGAGVSGSVVGRDVTESIPGGAGGTPIVETPAGAIDGVNLTYTLAHTPIAGTLLLFYGTLLTSPNDYSLAVNVITMTSALQAGNALRASYTF